MWRRDDKWSRSGGSMAGVVLHLLAAARRAVAAAQSSFQKFFF
jgi:hypothetical protein